MTEPVAPVTESAANAAEDIVEVIFEDHYMLAVAAFIVGAVLVAGIVYMIGVRNLAREGQDNAGAA